MASAERITEVIRPERIIPAVTKDEVVLKLSLEEASALRDTLGGSKVDTNSEAGLSGIYRALADVRGIATSALSPFVVVPRAVRESFESSSKASW